MNNLVDSENRKFLPLLNRPLETGSVLPLLSLQTSKPENQMFWHIAIKNKLTALLAESYAKSGNRSSLPAEYASQHESQATIISLYLDQLEIIGCHFYKSSLPVVVLENGGLAYGVYRNPGCYSFGDFDLLLGLQHFRRAHKILQDLGYEVLTGECADNSTGFDLTSGRVEYRMRFDNGLSLRLNVQPTLVARKWFFSENEPAVKNLFHRSLCIPERTVRILGREDFLFQLCVHNAAHGYIRKPGIRLHLDIDWYIRTVNKEIDWSAFVLLAQQMRVTTLTYFSLVIPHTFLGTPVPESVLAAIKPKPWKERLLMKTLAQGRLLNPDKKQFSKTGFILFNILIHDSLKELFRSVIPLRNCLTERYGLKEQQSRFMFLYRHYKSGAFGTR